MEDLMFIKEGSKWVCYDQFGHKAEGVTMDHARNLWHVYYDGKDIQIFDIKKHVDFITPQFGKQRVDF